MRCLFTLHFHRFQLYQLILCAKQTSFECCYFYMFIVEVLFIQSEHLLGIAFTNYLLFYANETPSQHLGKKTTSMPIFQTLCMVMWICLAFYRIMSNWITTCKLQKCCKLEIEVKFIYNLYQQISVPLSYQAITLASSMSYLTRIVLKKDKLPFRRLTFLRQRHKYCASEQTVY